MRNLIRAARSLKAEMLVAWRKSETTDLAAAALALNVSVAEAKKIPRKNMMEQSTFAWNVSNLLQKMQSQPSFWGGL
jgi:hypothetical protein